MYYTHNQTHCIDTKQSFSEIVDLRKKTLQATHGWLGIVLSNRLAGKIVHWHDNFHQRRALSRLDRRLLADIGVDPVAAQREIAKPFWQG